LASKEDDFFAQQETYHSERKLTMQLEASDKKKEQQLRDLQEQVRTLGAKQGLQDAQQTLAANEHEAKVRELGASHNQEKQKLLEKVEDLSETCK